MPQKLRGVFGLSSSRVRSDLIFYLRRYDKKLSEMSSTFYHDKFPLETCILNATSYFIAKWHKKSRIKLQLSS